MTQSLMTQAQQSAAAPGSADWAIGSGEALRLDIGPGERELQVTQGRLWLTREGTRDAPAQDLWLSAGDTVALDSGSEWVIEGWGHDGGDTRFQLLVPPRACATLARKLSVSSSQRRSSSSLVPALG
jgi:hypothetical protein